MITVRSICKPFGCAQDRFVDVQICRCYCRHVYHRISFITVLFLTFALLGCSDQNPDIKNEDSIPAIVFGLLQESKNVGIMLVPHDYFEYYMDSLRTLVFDTSTLRGKRQKLLNDFTLENGSTPPLYDTTFDLNYDGYDDFVIGYYGAAGTGIKNGIETYIFSPKIDAYEMSEEITSLTNPSFYISEKKITGFYIAYGCGEGSQLEWINNKWMCTKKFYVCNEEENSDWEIIYPLRNDTIHQKRNYQMVPPSDILETDFEDY